MTTLTNWQNPVLKEADATPCRKPASEVDYSLSFSHYQFTKIVEDWTSHLQYTAWQITKNKETAEDIVQEAFLALWKQQSRIIPGNPVGWLIKVVTNLSARYVKQKNTQLRIHNTLREGKDISCCDVEEYLIVKEKRNLLNETFNQLPSRQKIILHLSKNIGLRRDEIANCLQLSPNTVKVHLQRAMQFMKEHLACIVIISMLFVCNNILFKKSNTNDALRELYITRELTNIDMPDKIHDTQMTEPVTLKEITQAITFLLKR